MSILTTRLLHTSVTGKYAQLRKEGRPITPGLGMVISELEIVNVTFGVPPVDFWLSQ